MCEPRRGRYLCCRHVAHHPPSAAGKLIFTFSPPLLSLRRSTEVKKKQTTKKRSHKEPCMRLLFSPAFVLSPGHVPLFSPFLIVPEWLISGCLARANRLVSGLIRGARSNHAASLSVLSGCLLSPPDPPPPPTPCLCAASARPRCHG